MLRWLLGDVMWKPAAKLVLDPEERQLLETWARAHNAPERRDALSGGPAGRRRAGLRSRRPWALAGPPSCSGASATGGPQALVHCAFRAPPNDLGRDGQAHRARDDADDAARRNALELSDDGARAGCQPGDGAAPGLQPHRTRTFKLSRDTRFCSPMS